MRVNFIFTFMHISEGFFGHGSERKINIINVGSPGKAILGIDFHFQMKELLNHLALFRCFSEIYMAQGCPKVIRL